MGHYRQGAKPMKQIRKIEEAIGEIIFHAHPENEPVTIEYLPPVFNLVGYGTDAVVVSHPEYKGRVLKVFAEDRLHKVDQEFQVYQKLKGSPYFARCYGKGDNYLVLSHEQGLNLYQCLCEGIEIPEQVIIDVEHARREARLKGLNPRDIHLKNVLLQKGRGKLLDVSEYMKPGNDRRWDDLVEAYYEFYPLIRGRKVPVWLLESVKMMYNRKTSSAFSVREFGRKFVRWLGDTQSEGSADKNV